MMRKALPLRSAGKVQKSVARTVQTVGTQNFLSNKKSRAHAMRVM